MKRLLSLLIVPLLALAACGKEDSPATLPANEEGAALFASYAWEILDEFTVTGNVDELRAIMAPDCRTCRLLVEFSGAKIQGLVGSDITFTPEVTTFDTATNTYLVEGELTGTTTYHDGRGTRTLVAEAEEYYITVRHADGRWWLVDFTNYKREDS